MHDSLKSMNTAEINMTLILFDVHNFIFYCYVKKITEVFTHNHEKGESLKMAL